MSQGPFAPRPAGSGARSTSSALTSTPSTSTPPPQATAGFAGREVALPGPGHPPAPAHRLAPDEPGAQSPVTPAPPRSVGLVTHGAALLADLDRPYTGLLGHLLPEPGDPPSDEDPQERDFRTPGEGSPRSGDEAKAATPVRLHPASARPTPLGRSGAIVSSAMTWHIPHEQAVAQGDAIDIHLVQAAAQSTNQTVSSPTSADGSPQQPASPRADRDGH